MYKSTVTLCRLAVLAATAAFAQTKPAFEVATIKPAPPMDQAKVLAAMQAVKTPVFVPVSVSKIASASPLLLVTIAVIASTRAGLMFSSKSVTRTQIV